MELKRNIAVLQIRRDNGDKLEIIFHISASKNSLWLLNCLAKSGLIGDAAYVFVEK